MNRGALQRATRVGEFFKQESADLIVTDLP
jgi:hypothetical protein